MFTKHWGRWCLIKITIPKASLLLTLCQCRNQRLNIQTAFIQCRLSQQPPNRLAISSSSFWLTLKFKFFKYLSKLSLFRVFSSGIVIRWCYLCECVLCVCSRLSAVCLEPEVEVRSSKLVSRLYFFEKGFLTEPIELDWLPANSRDFPILASPVCTTVSSPSFLSGCWELNLDSSARS